MSDRENAPTDLFDVVCRLDDLAEWLAAEGYPEEGAAVKVTSDTLKDCIVITLVEPPL